MGYAWLAASFAPAMRAAVAVSAAISDSSRRHTYLPPSLPPLSVSDYVCALMACLLSAMPHPAADVSL